MATILYFKVYIINGDSCLQEIRRINITNSYGYGYSMFNNLITELRSIASLYNKSFSIAWKDAQGDLITISTDKELNLAVSEAIMAQSSFKKIVNLYILLNTDNPKKVEDKGRVVLRPSIICSACNGQVQSLRYECVICEHFMQCVSQATQCSSCVAKIAAIYDSSLKNPQETSTVVSAPEPKLHQ